MQRCVPPRITTGAEIQPVMLYMTLNTAAAHVTIAGLIIVLLYCAKRMRGIWFSFVGITPLSQAIKGKHQG